LPLSKSMTETGRPDAPNLADAAAHIRSAYVHIPFCARWCPYCDFAVVEGRDDSTDRYVRAVVSEIESEPAWGELGAIFFGGGTPSRLAPPLLGSIVEAVAERFGVADTAEVTLEANPEDWTEDLASGLVAQGFTRVSFGAQSFDPVVLTALGRAHTPDHIVRAVEAARSAGFSSVSLDLIYGTPGESMDSWARTVEKALGLEPDHLSAYALTVEPATPLGMQVRRGGAAPDPDLQADMWERAVAAAESACLVRYEVSNFAKPAHACLYNLGVWAQGEYLGFGLGAHGFRDGVRRRNVKRLDTYVERIESGLGAVQGTEVIEGWAAETERLMLGLRRAAGVTSGAGGEALMASDSGKRLVDAGVVGLSGDRLVVTRPLLTDEVVRAVLALGEYP